jgi:hypothetical protein
MECFGYNLVIILETFILDLALVIIYSKYFIHESLVYNFRNYYEAFSAGFNLYALNIRGLSDFKIG